jgi:5-methylcytosine-specific restriction endonuclease McrA
MRNRWIAQHPLCAHCEAEGRVTVATEVDHIVPIKRAPERRLDEASRPDFFKDRSNPIQHLLTYVGGPGYGISAAIFVCGRQG